MSEHSKLAGAIGKVADSFQQVIDDLFTVEQEFTKTVDDGKFSPYTTTIDSLIKQLEIHLDYTIDESKLSGELSPTIKEDIEKFNNEVGSKSIDCVVSTGVQYVLHQILSNHLQMINQPDETQPTVDFKQYKIPQQELNTFTKLKILLDFQIHLYLHEYHYMKPILYESISIVVRFLFSITTTEVDKFWYYMESRESIISTKVFSRDSVSDRISMLEVCNFLTDKYILRSARGEIFPNKKDSFNDVFQFRVRTFITNLLAFEDNTGLNKYFSVNNRYVPDFNKIGNQFLEDILYLQKLFNDPYRYLKKENSRELLVMMDRTLNVYEYLLTEESASRGKLIDQFAMPKPKSDREKIYLTEKYAHLQYFPESFWTTIPNTSMTEKDMNLYMDEFSKSKTRFQYLMQIYIIANLYFELTASNKRELLKSIGAPSNVKHITDETLTDSQKRFFFKVKKEVFAGLKTTDNQFAFLVQHLSLSEKIWWSWLIYGKNSDGKSFFARDDLSDDDLRQVSDQFQGILPFKSTKYFNTYVTPQLSRKMKAERGIEKLQYTERHENKYDDEIARLSAEIEQEPTPESIERRNTLLWKQLRQNRAKLWFNLSKTITINTLGGATASTTTTKVKRTAKDAGLDEHDEHDETSHENEAGHENKKLKV
jgi:THO complex subunit HPR1